MASPGSQKGNQLQLQKQNDGELLLHRRRTKAPQIYTPPPSGRSRTATKAYALNKKKQLTRKAEDCDRAAIIEHPKAGDNIVYQLNTGAYEILRSAIRPCLIHLGYKIQEAQETDQNGAIDHEILQVHYARKGGVTGRRLFTVNLYHTKSKVLVTGKDYDTYNQRIQPLIEEAIENCPNLKQINSYISKLCKQQLSVEKTSDNPNQIKGRAHSAHQTEHVTPKSIATSTTAKGSSTQTLCDSTGQTSPCPRAPDGVYGLACQNSTPVTTRDTPYVQSDRKIPMPTVQSRRGSTRRSHHQI